MAAHLRTPIAILKCQISYLEFLEWVAFLDLEERRHSKRDYYLAQIATEIRRANVKKPASVKIKDFLFTFQSTEKIEKMRKSKETWAAALKIDLTKN